MEIILFGFVVWAVICFFYAKWSHKNEIKTNMKIRNEFQEELREKSKKAEIAESIEADEDLDDSNILTEDILDVDLTDVDIDDKCLKDSYDKIEEFEEHPTIVMGAANYVQSINKVGKKSNGFKLTVLSYNEGCVAHLVQGDVKRNLKLDSKNFGFAMKEAEMKALQIL